MMDGNSVQEMMGADAIDVMLLRTRIPHPQMAVDVSEQALNKDEHHPELKELAQTIMNEQSAEIEQIRWVSAYGKLTRQTGRR
jgi:uncharacterized protein (DUF305 family)